jgi:hypothetical protein
MDTREFILVKQLAWAKKREIMLIGSAGDRGRKVYAESLAHNLFVPLSGDTWKNFEDGDGGELPTVNRVGKMQALHSSSALGVNVFEYWRQKDDAATIAAACGLCKKGSTAPESISFEQKERIFEDSPTAPNLDVEIKVSGNKTIKCYGIECKFTEAYSGRGHSGMSDKYFKEDNDLWDGIPNLLLFAKNLNPDDNHFKHLHAAQLVKHCLGLKKHYGKKGFRLLYLWYDALGEAGALHRREIGEFSNTAKADDVMFHAISYQELILKLERTLPDEHRHYVQYLASRYL